MNTFYLNTGVKQEDRGFLMEGEVFRGGVLQVPFDCEAPDNAELMFLCNNSDLFEDDEEADNIKVFEIHNTVIASKYAYFKVK
ncbi:MAG: hypothetical protein ACOC22_04605 [bacterium]